MVFEQLTQLTQPNTTNADTKKKNNSNANDYVYVATIAAYPF